MVSVALSGLLSDCSPLSRPHFYCFRSSKFNHDGDDECPPEDRVLYTVCMEEENHNLNLMHVRARKLTSESLWCPISVIVEGA